MSCILCPDSYSTIFNLAAYDRAKLHAQRILMRDIDSRERYVSETADQRVFWSYVNRRMSSSSYIKSIAHDGNLVHDSYEIASIFNTYFASIYMYKAAPTYSGGRDDDTANESLLDLPAKISLQNVIDVLNHLPLKTSVDSDGLSYKILKKGGGVLAFRLLQLFNLSLELSRIPSAWKVAVVNYSIHKKRI